jgi:hypothetical protein
MMVYSYNPSTQETEAKGLREFKASLEDWQDLVSKKKKKNQTSWALVVHACNCSYLGGREQGGLRFKVSPGGGGLNGSKTLSQKYPTQKRVGGVTQSKPQHHQKNQKPKQQQ